MKIVFTGGGTLGSVTPLLALYEELQHNSSQPPLILRGGEVGLKAYWIGTLRGVERAFVEKEGIRFFPIVSGKFRRYVDWRTLITPALTCIGFVHAFMLLFRLRPSCIIGAGGYVQVPVILAGWLLRIPSYVIQLDCRAGLANRLVIPFVQKIFIAFTETKDSFPKEKTMVVGSCVRPEFRQNIAKERNGRPLLLMIGGGTGALSLNTVLWEAALRLTNFCDIAHVTGVGKSRAITLSHYSSYELLTDALPSFIAWADVVVTRAGMGALSELATQGKAAVVVPLPDTSQEENAEVLARNDAAIVVAEKDLTSENLIATVSELLKDNERRTELGKNLQQCIPTDGAEKIARAIIAL